MQKLNPGPFIQLSETLPVEKLRLKLVYMLLLAIINEKNVILVVGLH